MTQCQSLIFYPYLSVDVSSSINILPEISIHPLEKVKCGTVLFLQP